MINNANVPQIRFDGFNIDWKEVKLKDLLVERNVLQLPSKEIPLVSFTVENGVTPKSDRYNREFLVKQNDKKYKFTKINDIVYNPANLKFGAISRNNYGNAVFSPIYVTFETTKLVTPQFIEIIVSSPNFIKKSLAFQEGTVYERMAVKPEDLLSIIVQIPTIVEQKKIGEFFHNLDNLITAESKKLDALKAHKKGMLQKMFPSDGKNIPELRFPEFRNNNEWELILFDEVFSFFQTNTFSRSEMTKEKKEVQNIHYGDILTKYGNNILDTSIIPYINENIDLKRFRDDSYLQDGDIIIADTAEDLTAGKVIEIRNVNSKILAGLHTMLCRPNKEFAPNFLGHYMNSPCYHSKIQTLLAGTKVYSINKSNIKKTGIHMPNIEEQQKIADCLNSLDELITAQNKKCYNLKQLKKGYLQKMFV